MVAADEENGATSLKREQPLPMSTCSIGQQSPVTTSTTVPPSAPPPTLSAFGIEPGVCLKNVAAIITHQHQQHHQQPPQQQAQTILTSAAANPTKELPSEVIAGTKEKPDFHFDKHSPFTGKDLFPPIPLYNEYLISIACRLPWGLLCCPPNKTISFSLGNVLSPVKILLNWNCRVLCHSA